MSGEAAFRVLGPLEATKEKTSIPLGGRKQRCVLAVLLLKANQAVSKDKLIDAVWGDQPHEGVSNTLSVYIANLRKVLDPDRAGGRGDGLIQTVAPGYVLWADAEHLDLIAFENGISQAADLAAGGKHAATTARLKSALDLWKGPLLADLADETFVLTEQARLERVRQSAIADLIESKMNAGGHLQVLHDLQRQVDEHPFDERLRGLLMVALYRSGRQADALATYQACRTALSEQLGIDPSPALAGLEQRILLQDPALVDALTSATGPATVRAPGSGDITPNAVLVVAGAEVPLLRAVTTLGRQADRDIVIDDDQTSRRHAEIRNANGVFLFVDLGSTNGTLVNGTPVRSQELVDGDVICIGTTELEFFTSSRSGSDPA